jgi:hypothetical protein
VIEETSTSIILGATFGIAKFNPRGVISGLQRRFLYYASQGHGRFIPFPPEENRPLRAQLIAMLKKLCEVSARCTFAKQAEPIWEGFQRSNRQQLDSARSDAASAFLNSAPRYVQKIAMIFQSSIWAKSEAETWDGIIHPDTLRLAIQHVDHCQWTASQLDVLCDQEAISSAADMLLARIRLEFSTPELVREGMIWLNKSQLTVKYAHHANRTTAMKTLELYQHLIPNLIERGLARIGTKEGKKTWYGFAVDDPW